MLLLCFLSVLMLSLGQWLLAPLLHAFMPLLTLNWLGWLVLALTLWLFSGSVFPGPPSGSKPR